jgi:hypothetical protein
MKAINKRILSKHIQSSEPQMLPTKHGFEQVHARPISIINGIVSNKKVAVK